jgi:hypothetical protein
MKYKILLFLMLLSTAGMAQTNTWSDNIASLVYNKCATCHHTGGIAPFSLMSYNDAVAAASGILDAVTDNRMPPWPPDTTYRKFAHQRALTIQQKTALLDWINNGLPAGNLANAPAPPVFPIGSSVNETPDLVAQMPVFTNYSASADIYQCFVVPSGLSISKYIKGFEVIPGNRQMVHHVLVYADTTGTCATLDAQDPNTGYLSFGGVGASSAQLIGLWVPGAQPQFYPNGMGLRLPANADIVFQIHYPSGTYGLQDSTKVNFFFSTASTIRPLYVAPILNHTSSLTNGPLFIAANQTKTFYGEYAVPALYGQISLLQVAPHMHLIGRSIQSHAEAAGGINIPLIKINNWNFMWQGGYDFQQIQVMPVASTLYFEAFYDNTLNNPFNPANPPVNVSEGEATNDEMMMIYFTFTGYQPGDENIIIDSTLITSVKTPEDLMNQSLNIFPNPVNSNELNFQTTILNGKKAEVKILDLSGQIVYKTELNPKEFNHKLKLPDLNNGMYLLFVNSNDKTYQQKFNYLR